MGLRALAVREADYRTFFTVRKSAYGLISSRLVVRRKSCDRTTEHYRGVITFLKHAVAIAYLSTGPETSSRSLETLKRNDYRSGSATFTTRVNPPV